VVRATGDREFMMTAFRIGRLCRLASADGEVRYGRELAVAVLRCVVRWNASEESGVSNINARSSWTRLSEHGPPVQLFPVSF
jgi:hypothetical protein